MEKDLLLTDAQIVHIKYLLSVRRYEDAHRIAEKYRQITPLHWNSASLFEITFLYGLCCHFLGQDEEASFHIKAVFYSAHAIGCCYANACRDLLIQRTDFPMSDYMKKLPNAAAESFPFPEVTGADGFSDGIFNADTDDVYTLGDLIHDLRTEQHVSLRQLCLGLCSKSKMSKIESGKLQPDIAMTEILLQRLGVTERIFSFWGNEKEARLHDLKFRLLHTRTLPENLVNDYLDSMKQIIDPASRLYYQDYLVASALCVRDPAQRIEALKEALRHTLPDFDIYQAGCFRLGWEELSILNCIAIAYRCLDSFDMCSLYFCHITEYIKRVRPDAMLQVQILPITVRTQARMLYRHKQYDAFLEMTGQYLTGRSVMYYNLETLASLLFYRCQALMEVSPSHAEESMLLATYSINLNNLLGYRPNALILRNGFLNAFHIQIND